MQRLGILMVLFFASATAESSASSAEPIQTVQAIRSASAPRPWGGPPPLPLPLAASWNTGTYSTGFSPDFQIAKITAGEYLLPWFYLPRPDELFVTFKHEASFRTAAELGLPVSFLSTQWDVLVAEELRDRTEGITADQRRLRLSKQKTEPLSPFSPVDVWYEAGRRWGAHPALQYLQEIYPDPPLVLFVSNNEQPKLTWREVQRSPEAHRQFGPDANDETVRRAVGDRWVERYKAMQRGFRDALTTPAWKQAAVFVGYDALNPSAVGRWRDWLDYSLVVADRLDPAPLAWEGVSPSYYVYDQVADSDFQIRGPQIEAMNWLPFMQEAFRLNPGLWFELSVWDGQQTAPPDKADFYRKLGQHFDPERYEGFVQFGMWLLRPRLVREFRDLLATRARFESYFDSILAAVRRVHEIPELRRFWESGRLLVNTATTHPYMIALPEYLAHAERWYLLDADLNPKRPWHLDTQIRVYSLALETGRAPQREWLVYAFTPLDAKAKTMLQIPKGPAVAVRASRRGCFSVLREADGTVGEITC